MQRKGAYILYLDVRHPIRMDVGMLRNSLFPAGRYLYVGSAFRGIDQRITRHRRLAAQKAGKPHWHIDYLLMHPDVRLTRTRALEKNAECKISRSIASRRGTTIPVPNFGSTDCVAGCKTHLYRVQTRTALLDSTRQNSYSAPKGLVI